MPSSFCDSNLPMRTHGESGHSPTGTPKTREYQTWVKMRNRCNDIGSDRYAFYGGRGIRICAEWNSFEAFLKDMGRCPAGMSLDRINNAGNYEPGNTRWATKKDQARNRRSNRLITINGRTQCMTAWAEEVGEDHTKIRARIKRGWDPVAAVLIKSEKRGRKIRTEDIPLLPY